MNYSLSGGGTLCMGDTTDSFLSKLWDRIKKAAKWLKDTLNQKGIPREIYN